MKRYLYFGEATVETTGEAAMFPVDAFLGATAIHAVKTQLFFKSRNGAATDDSVTITHGSMTSKAFMVELAKILQNNQKNPFLVVVDRANTPVIGGLSGQLVATEA
tara:strand:- start:331 stop:648 length:318 start_codon:yes stop_codon:yes gene_type:complete